MSANGLQISRRLERLQDVSIEVSKKVIEKWENDIYCIIKLVLLGLCSSSKMSS